MLQKQLQELSYIPNAKLYRSIAHALLPLGDHLKDQFQHTRERRAMGSAVRPCTARQLQVDHMVAERLCMAHKLQCMANLAHALRIMDHR